MTYLVIAAHPDDEVLGCGGTLARLGDEGFSTAILVLGEGHTSRFPNRAESDTETVSRLATVSADVGAFLGASEIRHVGLPDNRFDEVALLDVVKEIEKVIREIQPVEIFTQHGGDLNIDHAVTFRATMTATRPMLGSHLRAVHAYEVASSTEWSFQRFAPTFRANYFVDITATLGRKLRAMEMYTSEKREFPHPRSGKALEASAQRWGSVVGLEAAEAFETIWKIRR